MPFSELDNLRTQTQTAQIESASAASQTAAMMSLNLKLQSSASKNQAKNIELEIRSLEARETKELLGIVQVCIHIMLRTLVRLINCSSPICRNYMSNLTAMLQAAICSSSVCHIKLI